MTSPAPSVAALLASGQVDDVLAWHTRIHGHATMTAPAGEQTAPPTGDPAAPAPRVFDQDAVNRMLAREKDQGEKAAMSAVAEKLGMSIDDAKAFIEQKKQADQAAMSEADRRLAEATERENKAAQREAAAAVREHEAAVSAALLQARLDPDRLARARKLVEADPGADEKTIADAVTQLKKDEPAWFAAVAAGPPAGDPGTPAAGGAPAPRGGGAGKSLTERARDEALRRGVIKQPA